MPENSNFSRPVIKRNEEKKLAKSSSFKEKEKNSASSFKTPQKKKLNFQNKIDSMQFKSEYTTFDEEKSDIWEKGKDDDDLINELKEEIEEGIENSDSSYDSEEMDDEEMIADSKQKNKKINEHINNHKLSLEKNSNNREKLHETPKNERVNIY